ncbi:hypothetical protein [Flavobacterium sp. NRK1]|uniref:hypothetical protein n=1 Tax=Flavobacterium sp. NRK1 TaxID=2954929 RepID=UPI0020938AFF|nr:hypothetical protein [Flavobacterium sp. NRK1]MCO6149056.1 hypothetical protein [Flavobacterium sp. NRK1]
MNTRTITIEGREITLKFDYALLRKLGGAWGCDGPVAVMNTFSTAADTLVTALSALDASGAVEGQVYDFEIPFSVIGVFSDIIRLSAVGSDAPDGDACSEFIFKNPSETTEIIRLFLKSVPLNNGASKEVPAQVN